ncbi:YqhA family protein [Variovorax sp. GT1P44]|uniref:YqhA family protein n=1 Tax=Variovorax sp. GT1P44 TaxID=3443742 RepID=UPI003F453EB9
MPKWLEVHDLDTLKANLVGVVIAVLAVRVWREAVAWDGTSDIAAFGAAIALVVAALTLFLMKNNDPRH